MPATNVNWPTPLTRWPTLFPGQFGVPGTDSERGLRLNTDGCIFWVDPNHPDAHDGKDGTDPTSPMLTVGGALTKCQAYRGDIIAVMHNGMWTYGDMTSDNITPVQETVTVDVPGVRIVGVSPSSLGVPWIPTANNDVLITVHALDVVVEGFNFWPGALGYTGVTAILAEWGGPNNYYGENLTVRHCYFNIVDYGVALDFAWNCYIEDCRFEDIDAVAINNADTIGDPDYLVIRNNVFLDNTADVNLPGCDHVLVENNRFLNVTAAIAITGSAYSQIQGNTIQGDPTGANNMIDLTGGTGNLVCNNCLSCSIVQYDTCCSDATSGHWGGNHCGDGDTTAPPT